MTTVGEILVSPTTGFERQMFSEHAMARHDCVLHGLLPVLEWADEAELSMPKRKSKVTLPGKVQKIIKSPDPRVPEKAEINIEAAEPLYQEVRIENKLTDEEGKEVKLKKDATVEVTVEATDSGVIPKPSE